MNSLNRKIKLIVQKLPFLYKTLILIKYLYYRFIKHRYFKSFYLANSTNLSKIACNKSSITFFGYYNISPQNNIGDLLYITTNKEQTRSSKLCKVEINLKNKKSNYPKIATTRSWNWQQGCMLQWLPYTNNKIIFNDFDSDQNKYISKICNIETKLVEKIVNWPIYSIDNSGEFALTLNFERLSTLRPDYGYFNKNIKKYNELPDDINDGIWKIDLIRNKSKLILSLNTLKNIFPSITMENAQHKVNHIDIAPNGKRFIFLHRWQGQHGRFTRLISANTDGTEVLILNGDNMTSHCCWLNNEEILSFCEVNGKVGYFKFRDKTDNIVYFSKQMPKTDGHPSISPNKKFIITDNYPDQCRFSSLFLYDLNKDKIHKLGKFYQPLKYNNEMRIDLHPKWSPDGKSIFFESGHNGKRNLYKLDITNFI